MKYLITGGLGFIGQHIVKRLAREGHETLIVDNLSPQVHEWGRETYQGTKIKICDFVNVVQYQEWLQDCDHVIHLASETGTGQSMYQLTHYTEQNISKYASFLEYITQHNLPNLKTFSLSSSRSVYGEGAYLCMDHGRFSAQPRSVSQLEQGIFDILCPECGKAMESCETQENDHKEPLSVYASTKLTQEMLLKNLSLDQRIRKHIFRFQNVYGPGQSLSNPYTGILAIFSNLARAGETIRIFEDGNESRDFVSVEDVTRAVLQVISQSTTDTVLNIGTGRPVSVLDVANSINDYFGNKSEIVITGNTRLGDIRHNFASIRRLQETIGHTKFIQFDEGMCEFLNWVELQPLKNSNVFDESLKALDDNGLFVKQK